ncbi:hypothetical protein A2U01_0105128, partial [Trifolium medium]|nr:hypothetical protein [Trifolium medium]
VFENAQSGQSAGGTAGSRRESVGEKSVVVPNPSCNVAHKESQPSPAQNLNTVADGGCEVEPDAAPAVLLAVVV